MSIKQQRLILVCALGITCFTSCLEGPSIDENSSTTGDIVGEWRLKVENINIISVDYIYRRSFTGDGEYVSIDSSCFPNSSSSDPYQCVLSHREQGTYKKENLVLTFYKKKDSLEVMPGQSYIKDTMVYAIRRLDNDALIMVAKFQNEDGYSDSMIGSYFRLR